MDKWDRKTNFNCDSCMYFVEKKSIEHCEITLGRCRRNAPTMKGYPVVYSTDWCGEHKIGSNPVRDGIKYIKDAENDGQMHYECEKCGEKSPNAIGLVCRLCRGAIRDISPLTKEDVRKVLDEPLPNPVFDQPLVSEEAKIIEQVQKKIETSFAADCLVCHTKGYKIENETDCLIEISGDTIKITESKPDDNRKKETITAVYPVDLEEKAEIKAEINKLLDVIWEANNKVKVIGNKEYLVHEKTVNRAVPEIQELLEKL